MLYSIDYRELRNGRRYLTSDESKLGHHINTEEIVNRNSSEIVVGENPEMQTLTQEAVDEQISVYCSPDPPARGVDSAGARNVYLKASKFIPQD